MSNVNLAEFLLRASCETPTAAAIIESRGDRDRVVTFAELAAAVARTATLLQELGLKKGEGVLLWQPMSIALYVMMIATWFVGGVVVFIDPGQTRRHIAACAALWRIRILAGPWKAQGLSLLIPGFRTGVRRLVSAGWFPGAVSLSRYQTLPSYPGPMSFDESTPALVTFTSGGTGNPKAIVRSHGFLVAQHQVLQKELCLSAGQRDLTTMPIFLLANLGSSVTSIIPSGGAIRPGAVEPSAVVAQIQRHLPDRAGAAPAFWERLLTWSPLPGNALDSFQLIFTGGGPVYPELLSRLQAAASNAIVTAVYGSSEAEPIASLTAVELAGARHEMASRLLPGGHPVPGISVRVIRDQWGEPLGELSETAFADLALSPGFCGEIVVSGPLVIPGYLHGRGDEETKFRVNGTIWHRTGDAGAFDSDGRLWLAGRCAARIVIAGHRVYPFEVEMLARRVGIGRSALVEISGRPVIAVESDDRSTLTRLSSALADRGWQEVTVRRINRLPLDRRHNSKIDYPRLRKLLGN